MSLIFVIILHGKYLHHFLIFSPPSPLPTKKGHYSFPPSVLSLRSPACVWFTSFTPILCPFTSFIPLFIHLSFILDVCYQHASHVSLITLITFAIRDVLFSLGSCKHTSWSTPSRSHGSLTSSSQGSGLTHKPRFASVPCCLSDPKDSLIFASVKYIGVVS